jgi:hypothetical protein
VLKGGLGEGAMMSSPSNTTKWMSYLAEGLLAEEEVQPSNPFFWCPTQHPVEHVDCRYVPSGMRTEASCSSFFLL